MSIRNEATTGYYQGQSALMMAIRDGNYPTVPVDTCIQGKKRVDVPELYDTDQCRPVIRQVPGKPMFSLLKVYRKYSIILL